MAVGMSSCRGAAEPAASRTASSPKASPVSSVDCETPRPPGAFPSQFAPLALPRDAAIVAVPVRERANLMRVDIESPLSVKETFRHFLRALRGDDSFRVMFTEFDGFDAEISFVYDERFGFISIVVDCAGTLTAIRFERETEDQAE